MKRDLFLRYVWLIDTIRHAKKLTYEEISGLWKNAAINEDHSPLALRTFHNHREAIEDLFGISILCDRSDHNRYYVAENRIVPTKLKIWMLQTLSLSERFNNTSVTDRRIVLDIAPEETFGLTTAIDAMNHNFKLKLLYSIPTSDNRTLLTVEPYCVRFWNYRWYLLAKCSDTGNMIVFEFSRILNISIVKENFNYDNSFSPEDFFSKYFGMQIEPSLNPVKILLKVCGNTRNIIRTLPLHISQKEILAEKDYSVFEYFFVPSPDFKQVILSMGTDAEVIAPLDLRQKIQDTLIDLSRNYNDAPSVSLSV